MQFFSLDNLLAADHRARIVWSFVNSLDLTELYSKIQVSSTQAGRSAIAPEILVALWLLATLDGIGSAREIDRRCETDIAYRWIRGNVGVNYHTLSDFRVQHTEFLEQLLVDTVTSLIAQGLVPLEMIAQDGMRVRASAGSSSFRREKTLQKLQQDAQAHVDRLKLESEDESQRQQGEARRDAARQRAARERQQRVDEALRQHKELGERREKRRKGSGETTRTSTTDPEARNMKMADGGFRPAYNVQFATDGESRVIVGVAVTNEGTDGDQMPSMRDKVEADYGKSPRQMLVDGAFATKDSVTAVETEGTEVISSIPRFEQLKKHGKNPHERQKHDTDQYATFRERMGEEEYKELYKQRPSIAEFPNADCRNRNLHQFRVRGLLKVKAVALWHALAFNFFRMLRLGATWT